MWRLHVWVCSGLQLASTRHLIMLVGMCQSLWKQIRSVADNVKRIVLCALWVVIFNVVCSICVVALYGLSTELYGCNDSTHPRLHPPEYGVVPGRIGSGLRSGKFWHIQPVRWWFCVVGVTGGHDTCRLKDRKYRHAYDEFLTNTWLNHVSLYHINSWAPLDPSLVMRGELGLGVWLDLGDYSVRLGCFVKK